MTPPAFGFHFRVGKPPAWPKQWWRRMVRAVRGDQDSFPELKRSYTVTLCSNGSDYERNGRWPNGTSELEKSLARMLHSGLRKDEIQQLAGELHSFLFAGNELDVPFDRALRLPHQTLSQREIQISAENEALSLLSNLPWELARDTVPAEMGERLLLGTLASRPFVRAIDLAMSPVAVEARVRVQWCIANYKGDVMEFDAPAFDRAITEVLTDQPVDRFFVKAADYRPTLRQTVDGIDDADPHVFVFIGHGRTRYGKPQLRFEDWVDVEKFGQELAKTGQTLLAIFIACDQSRLIEAPAAQSGALTLIHQGIPAVVAMQGYVDPDRAKTFLKTFLSNLFVTHSISHAAAQGRVAMEQTAPKEAWTSDWVLPVVFRRGAKEVEEAQLSRILGHYQPALERLLTFIPPIAINLSRPDCETQLLRYLNEATGLVQISGGIGVGKSHLARLVAARRLREAIDSRASLPRPIFYIDLDEAGDDTTPEQWFLLKLQSRFADVRSLLARSTLTKFLSTTWTTDSVGVLREQLDSSRVVVIIDHCRSESMGFWTALMQQAIGFQQSLLVAIGAPRGVKQDVLKALDVPPFDLAETKRYVKQFVRDDEKLAVAWHDSSGGNPLLIDALRACEKTGVLKTPEDILRRRERNVAVSYIDLIKEASNEEEFDALSTFSWFPGLIPTQLARRFVAATDSFEQLSHLVEMGVLTPAEKFSEDWLSLGRLKADGLEEEERIRGAVVLTNRFREEVLAKDDAQQALDHLAAQPGGTTLLKAVQSAYIATGNHALALGLANLLTAALKDNPFELYRFFISVLEPKPQIEVPDSTWLEAAGAARRVGQLDQADSFLAPIEKKKSLTKYIAAQVLNVRAMIMKDRGQSEETATILNYCDQAAAIAEAGLKGEIAEAINAEEWRDLLSMVLFNRAAILKFFAGRSNDAVTDIRRVQQLAQKHNPYMAASAMCQEVDIQLSQLNAIEDWSFLLSLVRDAYNTLSKLQSADSLPYCCYQYARIYRKRPASSSADRTHYLNTAARFYGEAARTASEAGDFKRRAAAIEHWVRVQWKDLRDLPDVDAAAELDEILPALREYRGDAYATRILRDTLFLRAEIERMGSRAAEFLRAASAASVARPLNAAKRGEDRLRSIRIVIAYLESLKSNNDRANGDALLGDHYELFRQWLEDKHPDDPWITLTRLKEKEKLWAT